MNKYKIYFANRSHNADPEDFLDWMEIEAKTMFMALCEFHNKRGATDPIKIERV